MKEREGLRRGIYLLPNLFTTANLFCGYFAIVRAMHGHFVTAAWILFLAGVFDFLDGRIARLTNTKSDFGLEYDSLVDVCSFGLAPALLLYNWTLHNWGRLGWAIGFVYFACGALRLARFNVQAGGDEKKFFTGLPIPAAAAFPVAFLIFHSRYLKDLISPTGIVCGMMLISAWLMVSRVPYISLKPFEKVKGANFFLLIMTVIFFFFFALSPAATIFALSVTYVAIGIILEIRHALLHAASFGDYMGRYFSVHWPSFKHWLRGAFRTESESDDTNHPNEDVEESEDRELNQKQVKAQVGERPFRVIPPSS